MFTKTVQLLSTLKPCTQQNLYAFHPVSQNFFSVIFETFHTMKSSSNTRLFFTLGSQTDKVCALAVSSSGALSF